MCLCTETPTTEHHHDEKSCKREHVGCCRHASSLTKGKSFQDNKDHYFTMSKNRDACHKDTHHEARKSQHDGQLHRSKHCRQPGVTDNKESEHPSSPDVHRHRASISRTKRKSSADAHVDDLNHTSKSKLCGDKAECEPIQYQRYHGNYWYGNVDRPAQQRYWGVSWISNAWQLPVQPVWFGFLIAGISRLHW